MGSAEELENVEELVNTSILIPRRVQRAVRLLAARNERSMGAEIRDAIDKAIAEADREPEDVTA